MARRLAPLAAGLSLLGLLGWLSLAGPGREDAPPPGGGEIGIDERAPASGMPCRAPLGWRVDRVDPGFGLDADEVRAAAERAASLWEEAADRRLFVHDPAEGLPIRLVYGERQARATERRRREAELRDERRRVEELRRRLDDRRRELAAAREVHDDRVRDFRSRLDAHNADVRRRNGTGGAAGEALDSLRAREQALRRERRSLEEERRELEERARSLRTEQERLNRRIRAHERRAEELERSFPPGSVEAGAYREVVREEDGRPVAVRREIRIHRFGSPEDLVRVLAHELGHARGLGHTDVPGSLMTERYGAAELDVAAAPGPGDRALLRAHCPDA